MKKKKKIVLSVLFIAAAIAVTFFLCVFLRIREYRTLDMIRLTAIVRENLPLDVPVAYIPEKPAGKFRAFAVLEQSRKNYFLHWNMETGELFFSIARWEFGGLGVLHGNYRITEPAVKARLISFLKTHDWE